jgi:hypothetical protein
MSQLNPLHTLTPPSLRDAFQYILTSSAYKESRLFIIHLTTIFSITFMPR